MRILLATSLSLFCAGPLLAQVAGEAPDSAGPGNPVISPAANEEIVPASARTVMGGSANSIPWSWTPTRFQSVYLETELPQRGYPIRCIAFRSNNRIDTGSTIDLEMWLGYTSHDAQTITTNYASNYNVTGQNKVLVFRRKMVKLADMERNTNALFFQYQLQLDTPFIWSPVNGRNLIFECKVHGNSNNNRSFSFFPDNESGTGTTTTRIWSDNNPNATTGRMTRSYGPVLRFDFKCKVSGEFVEYGSGCRGTGGFAGAALPASFATSYANSSSYFGLGRANMNYMQTHDASTVTTPLSITALTFRQSSRIAGRAGGAQTLQIRIGTTRSTPTGLNTEFGKNFDLGGSTVAFKGTVNIPTTTGVGSDPTKFPLSIKFSKPWVFVPVRGHNIAWQTINTSTTNVIKYFDYASIIPTKPEMGSLYALSSTASYATAILVGRGYVTGFQTTGAGRAIPQIGSTGRPVIGRTFEVTLQQAKKSSAAVSALGLSDKTWNAFKLPFALAPLAAPGCSLLASLDLLAPVATDSTGNAKISLPLPNNASLVNVKLYHQWLVVDTANALKLSFSDAGRTTIGEQ